MLARDWLNTYYLEDTGLFRVSLSPFSGSVKITMGLFSFGGSMERESAGEPVQIATENGDLSVDLRGEISYVRKHHKITN